MKQKIQDLNEKELAWINAQIDIASSFVDTFGLGDKTRPPSLGSLDAAFAAWIDTKPTDGNMINDIINGVGMAFGSRLVEGLGFRWVVAIDDQGSDLAVHGFPGRGDMLVYPANFVAKRWDRREVNFLETSYRLIEEDMRKLKESYAAKP